MRPQCMLSLQEPVEENEPCREPHGTENFQARDGWELPGNLQQLGMTWVESVTFKKNINNCFLHFYGGKTLEK